MTSINIFLLTGEASIMRDINKQPSTGFKHGPESC